MYVDTRLFCGQPKMRAGIVRMAFSAIYDMVGPDRYQVIAGGETAGIPFAAWIADRAHKSMAYIRKEPKGFGRGSQIEGLTEAELAMGRKFLLVEDLCTDGASKQNFIQAIRQSGNIVNDVLVVFSYGCFGAASVLAQDGVTLHAMCDAARLVEVALDLQEYYTEEERLAYPLPSLDVIAQVQAFINAPGAYVGT